MKKLLALTAFAMVVAGCASLTSTTGTKGVRFGMSSGYVLDRIRSTETVLDSSEEQIVSDGPMEKNARTYRKTYTFMGDRLNCVQYELARGGSKVTLCE